MRGDSLSPDGLVQMVAPDWSCFRPPAMTPRPIPDGPRSDAEALGGAKWLRGTGSGQCVCSRKQKVASEWEYGQGIHL